MHFVGLCIVLNTLIFFSQSGSAQTQSQLQYCQPTQQWGTICMEKNLAVSYVYYTCFISVIEQTFFGKILL